MDRDALVQAILDLDRGCHGPVADESLAYELAHHIKPFVDRLSGLKEGLDSDEDLDIESTLSELGEAAQLEEADQLEDTKASGDTKVREHPRARPPAAEGPLPELGSLPAQEQARWIFMERYIPLEVHEDILNCHLAPEDFASYQQAFGRLLQDLLSLPRTVEAAEKSDIPALQKIFASCVLIFRHSQLGGSEGEPIPCTIENLRRCYPAYFFKRRKAWYQRRDFYTRPMDRSQWALCDTEYLNCTLRKPESKLASYARSWNLPPGYVRQKTILEDIYDRILCGEALSEDIFASHCNACTASLYRNHPGGPQRLVYTVQKAHKIAIQGKVGIPHWRTSRRLWPGVFPSVKHPQ